MPNNNRETLGKLNLLKPVALGTMLAVSAGVTGCANPELTARLDDNAVWRPKKMANNSSGGADFSAEEGGDTGAHEITDAINPDSATGQLYVEALSGKLPNGLRSETNGFYPIRLADGTIAVLLRPDGRNLIVTEAGQEKFEQGQRLDPKDIIVVNTANFNLERAFKKVLGNIPVTPLHLTIASFGYSVLGLGISEAVQYAADQVGLDLTQLNPFYQLAKLFPKKDLDVEEYVQEIEKADSAQLVLIAKSFPAPFGEAIVNAKGEEQLTAILQTYQALAKNQPEQANAALAKLKASNEKNPQNETERVLALAELALAQNGVTAANTETFAGTTPNVKGEEFNTETGGVAASLSTRRSEDGVNYDTGAHVTRFGVGNDSQATGGSWFFDREVDKNVTVTGEFGHLRLNRGATTNDGMGYETERPAANYFDAKGGLKITLANGTEMSLAAGAYKLNYTGRDNQSGGIIAAGVKQDLSEIIPELKDNPYIADASMEGSVYSGFVHTGDVVFGAKLGGRDGLPVRISVTRPGYFSVYPLAPFVREDNGKEIETEIGATITAYTAAMHAVRKTDRTPENLAALEAATNNLPNKTLRAEAGSCIEASENCPAWIEKITLRISDRFQILTERWKESLRGLANARGAGDFRAVARLIAKKMNTEREITTLLPPEAPADTTAPVVENVNVGGRIVKEATAGEYGEGRVSDASGLSAAWNVSGNYEVTVDNGFGVTFVLNASKYTMTTAGNIVRITLAADAIPVGHAGGSIDVRTKAGVLTDGTGGNPIAGNIRVIWTSIVP